MSALGHKQTLEQSSEMSALPTKADMRLAIQKCPLRAISRHRVGDRRERPQSQQTGPDPAVVVGEGER